MMSEESTDIPQTDPAQAAPVGEDDWAEAFAEEQQQQAGSASAEGAAPETPSTGRAKRAAFGALKPGSAEPPEGSDRLDLVMDIPVTLSVELGRTKIQIKELLQLAQGSVVDLDRLAGEPMDVLVNGFLIARGEVVMVNDNFGIRLTDIVSPSERARRLT
jgi:flagellar motor switch protein FliN/FliY